MLSIEETTWHLKSQAIWLEEGDSNTKIFHKLAEHRKVVNSIRKLEGYDVTKLKYSKDLTKGGVPFFRLCLRSERRIM